MSKKLLVFIAVVILVGAATYFYIYKRSPIVDQQIVEGTITEKEMVDLKNVLEQAIEVGKKSLVYSLSSRPTLALSATADFALHSPAFLSSRLLCTKIQTPPKANHYSFLTPAGIQKEKKQMKKPLPYHPIQRRSMRCFLKASSCCPIKTQSQRPAWPS